VTLIAILAVAVGVYIGADYYHLPARDRVHHAQHPVLRSSGSAGLACGISGTALFLVNLSYLLRKRLLSLQWLGTLRAWMGMHVVSGILGALLVLFHSSFLPRSALGLLALSGLGIVIATGLVGRYLYALVPRAKDGHEMDAPELRAHLLKLREELAAAGIPAEQILGRKELRALGKRLKGHPEAKLIPLARAFARDRRRLARLNELRSLLGSWRFFHRWLAIVMLVLAALHVAVALRFGEILA
jgi:hypothetical protein